MRQIAVLITCFNRKEKTLSCLKDIYAQEKADDISMDIYVIDGGSTDGTPASIAREYPQVHIKVCSGLYWAGGMREAWKEAVKNKEYDFYWLLNDDTHLYSYCLTECLKADKYSLQTYGKQGIYIGSTQDPNTFKLSYGGIDKNGKWIVPNGEHYMECELGNANIMMVSKSVLQIIGGFCEEYTHGIADYDYTLRATRSGIPVLVLPTYGGTCENDHKSTWLSQSTSLKKRIEYLYSPKGLAYKEYMTYVKKFYPQKAFNIKCKLWLKTLFPCIWEHLKNTDPQ